VFVAASRYKALAGVLLSGLSAGLPKDQGSLRERAARYSGVAESFDALLASARRDALDERADAAARVDAVRLLPTGTFAESKAVLTKLLAGNQPHALQVASLAALDQFTDPEVGSIVTNAWPGMSPAIRAAAANVIFARPERAAAFLDAVEAGKIKAADVDRGRLKALETSENAALRERAKKLLAAGSNTARQEVFAAYRPALSLAGDAGHGKAVFEKSCAACHRVNDVGQEIGPNLAAMKSRGAEAILLNVIDPNAEVNPLFVDYVVQTKTGRTTSGMLASETAAGITLKRAGGETETINRADVKRMRSSGLSIMPEGLEQGVDHQAMADLIAYILSAN
jgi:putative heme-binding domain-containing protein